MLYVTDVSVPNHGAQSEQIRGMALCLKRELKEEFHFVCAKPLKSYALNIPADTIFFRTSKITLVKKIRAVSKLVSVLCKARYSTIYTRQLYIALASRILSNARVYFEIHQPIENSYNKLMFNLLARSNRFEVTTITGSLKLYLQREFHFDRAVHLPNAAFISDAKEICTDNSIVKAMVSYKQQGYKVLCHTGSLQFDRGLDIFLRVVEKCQHVVFFHIGGSQSDVNKYTKVYGRHPNLILHPNIKKPCIIEVQKCADYLFYMTSVNSDIFWCTSPNKVYEYFIAGKPIIAPRIGSILEVLSSKNSTLFESESDLIQKITDNELVNYVEENTEKYTMNYRVKTLIKMIYNV